MARQIDNCIENEECEEIRRRADTIEDAIERSHMASLNNARPGIRHEVFLNLTRKPGSRTKDLSRFSWYGKTKRYGSMLLRKIISRC